MSFVFRGQEVYPASYIKEHIPDAFRYKTQRTAIAELGIPKSIILYAVNRGSNWTKSYESNTRSTLLVPKEWVDSHIPAFISKIHLSRSIKTPTKSKVYEYAPDILELEEHEKFRDTDGNVIDIEVRGERDINNCYFCANDISKMLNIKDITGTLQSTNSAFERNKDFITFNIGSVKFTPCIFLTFHGLTRLLFVRRHPIAKHFQEWAINILFTIKHGTSDTKEKLTSDILGIDITNIKAFLNTSAASLPTVYLFILGRIEDLRESLEIDLDYELPNDNIVAKFGFTEDLERRTNQHNTTYSNLCNTSPQLFAHAVVEPKVLSEAERDIREFFIENDCLITDNPKHRELVTFTEKFLPTIKRAYVAVGLKFEGRLSVLRREIDKLTLILHEKDKTIAEIKEIAHMFAPTKNPIRRKVITITHPSK